MSLDQASGNEESLNTASRNEDSMNQESLGECSDDATADQVEPAKLSPQITPTQRAISKLERARVDPEIIKAVKEAFRRQEARIKILDRELEDFRRREAGRGKTGRSHAGAARSRSGIKETVPDDVSSSSLSF